MSVGSGAQLARGSAGAVPRRVLYLTDLKPSEKFGSLEEMILSLAAAFAARGSLFLPVFGGPLTMSMVEQYQTAGLEIEWLNLDGFRRFCLARLRELIRHHRIDLVDWNFYPPINGYVHALSFMGPAVEQYFTYHNSRVPGDRASTSLVARLVRRVLLGRYHRVLCISDFVQSALRAEGAWSNLTRCRLFVNTERFAPSADTRARVRAAMGAESRFVVVTVAQLIRWKGIDVAIKALCTLPDRVVLWVVGDGEERRALAALTESLSLSHRVRFLGWQPHVEPYMQAADCLACPSVWFEAAGLVNLEGQACGLPVVASRVGGIPEFVEDGTTGMLFEPGDATHMAESIRRLLDDEPRQREMGRRAREAAVTKFSGARCLEAYLNLYQGAAHA